MFENKPSDYELMTKKLKVMFQLDKSPVAVKLYENEEDAKQLLNKYEGKERHCGLKYNVAQNQESYYATLDEISCPNGATALGLLNGNLIEGIPRVEPIMKAVGYAPLEKSPFQPDSVVIYVNVMQTMKITQVLRQATGKRMTSDFAAIASLCADAVAKPYLEKQSNVTIGCNGSRGFTDIRPDEMVIGLTMEDILSIVNY